MAECLLRCIAGHEPAVALWSLKGLFVKVFFAPEYVKSWTGNDEDDSPNGVACVIPTTLPGRRWCGSAHPNGTNKAPLYEYTVRRPRVTV